MGDEIAVDMDGQWATAIEPDWLTTLGIDTCISVAVMDDVERQAWLIHAPTFSQSTDTLLEMLDTSSARTPGGVGLRVEVHGGRMDDQESASDVKLARTAVTAALKANLPAANISYAWGHGENLEVIWEDQRWAVNAI